MKMRSGCLVVDDTLISSKSYDVELKCVSERKQSKEDAVTDCVACSLTSIHLYKILRLEGDTQENNVIQMMTNR